MTDGQLNETSAAIGRLQGQMDAVKESVGSLHDRFSEHTEVTREMFSSINAVLNDIKGQLVSGARRMDTLDTDIRGIGTRLDQHMRDESSSIKSVVEKQENHSARLTAIDDPKDGRLPKVEEITKSIDAVHRTGRMAVVLAGAVATFASAWAAIKHWGS